MITCELLTFSKESTRSRVMLDEMWRAAPVNVAIRRTQQYEGQSQWLMVWGPGEPRRQAVIAEHLAAGEGRHVICWDVGYWDRTRANRVSIDAPHPQAWVMRRDRPIDRRVAAGVSVTDAWDPLGPIVIAGLGRKAREQYTETVIESWERGIKAACAEMWPERKIIYRPKPTKAAPALEPIEQTLRGASLACTWHSNVAVDAIRLGIPVVCRDGAAAAVCPKHLRLDPMPLFMSAAFRFLSNLAWFQWTPAEAASAWRFLIEELAA